jgi:hypothetical protein
MNYAQENPPLFGDQKYFPVDQKTGQERKQLRPFSIQIGMILRV